MTLNGAPPPTGVAFRMAVGGLSVGVGWDVGWGFGGVVGGAVGTGRGAGRTVALGDGLTIAAAVVGAAG